MRKYLCQFLGTSYFFVSKCKTSNTFLEISVSTLVCEQLFGRSVYVGAVGRYSIVHV